MNNRAHGIKYKLRQAAKNDLKEIGRYTLKNHGKTQRDKYLKGLEERFELLSGNPGFGRPRDDIKAGYHCSDYGKHVVFYCIRKNFVEILAVLHNSMVPELHL
ncbi:MAG: type II toxin-antitoxin system RelE/ParE family toxin [Pseudomonadales bacterium]